MKLIYLVLLVLPLLGQVKFAGAPSFPTVVDPSNTTCSSSNLPTASANPGLFFQVVDVSPTWTKVIPCVSNGTNWVQWAGGGGGSMVYPGAGVPKSTGSGWGTSYTAQGTDTHVMTSGTVSGLSVLLCTDSSAGATTVGCPSAGSVTWELGGTTIVAGVGFNIVTGTGVIPSCSDVSAVMTCTFNADTSYLLTNAANQAGTTLSVHATSDTALNGVVSTSGSTVTWVSGNQFQSNQVGGVITINSVNYTVATFVNSLTLTLTTSPTTMTSVLYTQNVGPDFIASVTPALTTYTQGQLFIFTPADRECSGSDTLNIGGLGPLPLQKLVAGALVAVAADDCLIGVPNLIMAVGSSVTAFRIML